MQFLIGAVFFIAPAALIYLARHQQWAARLGVIVLCYALGLLVGAVGLVPEAARSVPELLSELTIVLALPLLLFTLDIRRWSKVAGRALLSMVLANAAVVCLATLLYFAYREEAASQAANLAAMSVGVYTGGTPNLAAIKTGLDIPNAQYLAFHSLDMLIGAGYFLLMLTIGVPLFRKLLPAPTQLSTDEVDAAEPVDEDDYRPLLERGNAAQVIAALLMGVAVLAVSMGVAQLQAAISGGEMNSAVLIICLTTLGLALSLVQCVRELWLAYRLGMYLVYVFCFSVASMVNLEQLASIDATVLVFLLVVVFAGLFLHALLSRLFKVDADTFMATSVAAVASPPFVPMMARALGNPAAMLPGMTTGVIGYALGSYLGISLGLYLHSLS